MNKEIELKLDEVLNYFNSSVNGTLENSRNTAEFRDRLQDLRRQYIRVLDQTFRNLGFSRSSIIDYATSQFDVLMQHFIKKANSHGSNIVDTMIKMNKAEIERAVEILENSDLSQEEKITELSQTTSSKMGKLSDEGATQTRQDNQELESFKSDLSLLVADISSHTQRLATSGLGPRDYVQISAIESKVQQLRQYLDSKVNKDFIGKCSEAMHAHINGMMLELSAKNDVWLTELNRMVSQQKRETPQIEDNEAAFKLPDTYRKKVEEVGKTPTPVPSSTHDTPDKLPSDFL